MGLTPKTTLKYFPAYYHSVFLFSLFDASDVFHMYYSPGIRKNSPTGL